MANINHSTLTDPYLHEPKGAYGATVGKVYVSNGSASGVWTAKETLSGEVISGFITDVSTAATVYVPMPFAGTINKVVTVLEGAISNADSIITVKNAAAATMGTITVAQSGSAAGDVDTVSPSSNHTVAANSFITVATSGASQTARVLRFVIVLDRT